MRDTIESDSISLIKLIVSVLIPPLGVYFKEEKLSINFWVNIVLCLFFVFPGLVHLYYLSAGKRKNESVLSKIFKTIISVIIPPLGVYLRHGVADAFWLNLLLTFLGYLPGLIHLLYLINRATILENDKTASSNLNS